jgi:hypothetical protein
MNDFIVYSGATEVLLDQPDMSGIIFNDNYRNAVGIGHLASVRQSRNCSRPGLPAEFLGLLAPIFFQMAPGKTFSYAENGINRDLNRERCGENKVRILVMKTNPPPAPLFQRGVMEEQF